MDEDLYLGIRQDRLGVVFDFILCLCNVELEFDLRLGPSHIIQSDLQGDLILAYVLGICCIHNQVVGIGWVVNEVRLEHDRTCVIQIDHSQVIRWLVLAWNLTEAKGQL